LASLKYDTRANAFYVKIRKGKVAQTEPISDSIFLDLDAKGKLVGVEVILPKDLPQETAKKLSVATAR
jgi:uncharacterized protein YuzE